MRDYANSHFTPCEPAEIRNRPIAASSARTLSMRQQSPTLSVATAWIRIPGSSVVPCERSKAANPRHRPLDPEVIAFDPLLQVLADVMEGSCGRNPSFWA